MFITMFSNDEASGLVRQMMNICANINILLPLICNVISYQGIKVNLFNKHAAKLPLIRHNTRGRN